MGTLSAHPGGDPPRKRAVLALVLVLALGITFLAAWAANRNVTTAAVRAFDARVARAEAAILERLRSYESVVRGGAGLFAATDNVDRADWRNYVSSLRLRDMFPGVRGMHVARRVAAADLEQHVKALQAEGFKDYGIRPPGARAEYYPVVLPEPLDARNRRVIGFDMFAEPVRREAMERARDTGLPTISGRVVLAGESAEQVPGFLLYLPVYRRGASAVTLAERREAITGFVFCPFRMPDLMMGVLGDALDYLDLEIYDGALPTKDNRLFASTIAFRALAADPGAYATRRHVEFGGRLWTLFYAPTPQFLSGIDRRTPLLILAAGLLITLALTAGTARLLNAESRAQEASMRDALTGLFNRRYLDEAMKREQGRARRAGSTVGVIQLDLDHFKTLNDVHGHDAGDAVLRAVATLIDAQTRGEDIACRYGGEELTLLLPEASLSGTVVRAEQLREGVAGLQVVHHGERLPQVTVSAGVAAYPQHGPDLNGVLRQADQALLRAKEQGRNRVIAA